MCKTRKKWYRPLEHKAYRTWNESNGNKSHITAKQALIFEHIICRGTGIDKMKDSHTLLCTFLDHASVDLDPWYNLTGWIVNSLFETISTTYSNYLLFIMLPVDSKRKSLSVCRPWIEMRLPKLRQWLPRKWTWNMKMMGTLSLSWKSLDWCVTDRMHSYRYNILFSEHDNAPCTV